MNKLPIFEAEAALVELADEALELTERVFVLGDHLAPLIGHIIVGEEAILVEQSWIVEARHLLSVFWRMFPVINTEK